MCFSTSFESLFENGHLLHLAIASLLAEATTAAKAAAAATAEGAAAAEEAAEEVAGAVAVAGGAAIAPPFGETSLASPMASNPALLSHSSILSPAPLSLASSSRWQAIIC